MQQRLIFAYRIVVVELIANAHRIASQTVGAIFYRRKILPNIIIIPIAAQIWIFGNVKTFTMVVLCGRHLLMGRIRIALVNAVVIVFAHRHQFAIVILLVFAVVIVPYIVLVL